jgi:hypothetical protein
LNAEKTALKVERDKFAAEVQQARAALQTERETWQQERQQNEATNKPEAYDAWSVKETQKAQNLLAQATKAEDEGDFDKAEQFKAKASEAQAYARLAKEQAEQLRRNPPPGEQQRQAQRQAQVKEWTLKAAQDFPEFAKKESPTQLETVAFLKQVGARFPRFANAPELMYFAAERAAYKTAADRVPGLEKELTEAKKRVAELEALTSPTPPGGATQLPGDRSWNDLSPEEQYAQLRNEAQGMR